MSRAPDCRTSSLNCRCKRCFLSIGQPEVLVFVRCLRFSFTACKVMYTINKTTLLSNAVGIPLYWSQMVRFSVKAIMIDIERTTFRTHSNPSHSMFTLINEGMWSIFCNSCVNQWIFKSFEMCSIFSLKELKLVRLTCNVLRHF